MENYQSILCLHRYYIWANKMRTHFDEQLKLGMTDPLIEPYMSYWYGGLYVVIEGWLGLQLSDPVIDRLIAPVSEEEDNPFVQLLKRYRNGAFHYQRNYFDDRFIDFMKDTGSAEWIRNLNREFGRYFLERLSRDRAD